jgi:hypothetical protein
MDHAALLQADRRLENLAIVLSGQAAYQPTALRLWQQRLQLFLAHQ